MNMLFFINYTNVDTILIFVMFWLTKITLKKKMINDHVYCKLTI